MTTIRDRARRAALRAGAVGLVLSTGLAGCSLGNDTGSDGPPATSSSSESSASGEAPRAEKVYSGKKTFEITEDMLAISQGAPKATLRGKPRAEGADREAPLDVPAKIGVVRVEAGRTATRLVWELSATRPASVSSLASEYYGLPDLVTFVDVEARKRYHVLTVVDGKCLCSEKPDDIVSKPFRMTWLYPPLPDGVTKVRVEAPFFNAQMVDVTR